MTHVPTCKNCGRRAESGSGELIKLGEGNYYHVSCLNEMLEKLTKIEWLLDTLFEPGESLVSGHNVFNGADYLRCTCCKNTANVLGYACDEDMSQVKHAPDCALNALYRLMKDQ